MDFGKPGRAQHLLGNLENERCSVVVRESVSLEGMARRGSFRPDSL